MKNQSIYLFNQFHLDPAQKILLRDGERVLLNPKTFQMLLALVEAEGRVISKDDLIAKVWPDVVVEESNLTKNISQLRRALANGHDGAELIETIPKIGYRFLVPVQKNEVQPETPGATPMSDGVATRPPVAHAWKLRAVAMILLLIAGVALYRWSVGQASSRESGRAAVQRLTASGREFWNRRTIEGFRQGLTCFEQARDLDSSYAPAWAGIADSWSLLVEYGFATPEEGYPKAKAAALRALELDGNQIEAHTALATIKEYYEWDWVGAEESFRRALELNPQYATAYQWYAEFLMGQGRFAESLAEIRRAQSLAPNSLIIQATEARILCTSGDYNGAIAKSRELLERHPDFAEAYSYIGAAYEHQRMYRQAFDAYEQRSQMMGDNTPTASALRTEPVRDARDYWEKRLKLEEVKLSGSPFAQAQALAQLSKIEEAITLLEQSCNKGFASVAHLRVNKNYDPLRGHPRFQALMRRVHLTP